MKQLNPMANLAAKKRLDHNAVSRYVFECIYQDTNKQVGIMSCLPITRTWCKSVHGGGTYRCWEVSVADSGNTYTKRVTLSRYKSGHLATARIS